MAVSEKSVTKRDSDDVLKYSFNEEGRTLGVDGFLSGKVGHKVEVTISTTNVANDTETYTFSDSGTTLFEIEVIYSDGTRQVLESAERIS